MPWLGELQQYPACRVLCDVTCYLRRVRAESDHWWEDTLCSSGGSCFSLFAGGVFPCTPCLSPPLNSPFRITQVPAFPELATLSSPAQSKLPSPLLFWLLRGLLISVMHCYQHVVPCPLQAGSLSLLPTAASQNLIPEAHTCGTSEWLVSLQTEPGPKREITLPSYWVIAPPGCQGTGSAFPSSPASTSENPFYRWRNWGSERSACSRSHS